MEHRTGPAVGLTVEELLHTFESEGIRRAFVVHTAQGLVCSHPDQLGPVLDLIGSSPDFAEHEAVFIGRDERFPTLFFAFVHKTCRGLAQGGLRFVGYAAAVDLLNDGLRLSRGMTRKNALAGLWWGGGKGILARTAGIEARPELLVDSPERDELFEAYGSFIASLQGVYYTAEDMGTRTRDMDSILRRNRFISCISVDRGGSGNPSESTARGVLQAIRAAWKHLKGKSSLKGVRVAIQGVGHVGGHLARLLAKESAILTISDPVTAAVEAIVQEVPGTRVVEGDAIFDVEADIFAPCARGAQVNAETIPRLKVQLICGAANNILGSPEHDAKALEAHGILFVPDYVANRMGIVNCANEWCGKPLESDIEQATKAVYRDTLKLLEKAKKSGETTTRAAEIWADEKACELHPLFKHRGKQLIERLVEENWAEVL